MEIGINIAEITNSTLKAIAQEVDESGVSKKDGYVDASELGIFAQKAQEGMSKAEYTQEDFNQVMDLFKLTPSKETCEDTNEIKEQKYREKVENEATLPSILIDKKVKYKDLLSELKFLEGDSAEKTERSFVAGFWGAGAGVAGIVGSALYAFAKEKDWLCNILNLKTSSVLGIVGLGTALGLGAYKIYESIKTSNKEEKIQNIKQQMQQLVMEIEQLEIELNKS